MDNGSQVSHYLDRGNIEIPQSYKIGIGGTSVNSWIGEMR